MYNAGALVLEPPPTVAHPRGSAWDHGAPKLVRRCDKTPDCTYVWRTGAFSDCPARPRSPGPARCARGGP